MCTVRPIPELEGRHDAGRCDRPAFDRTVRPWAQSPFSQTRRGQASGPPRELATPGGRLGRRRRGDHCRRQVRRRLRAPELPAQRAADPHAVGDGGPRQRGARSDARPRPGRFRGDAHAQERRRTRREQAVAARLHARWPARAARGAADLGE